MDRHEYKSLFPQTVSYAKRLLCRDLLIKCGIIVSQQSWPQSSLFLQKWLHSRLFGPATKTHMRFTI